MADKYDITFGADPELFIVDKKGNIIPSCGLIGGDKGKAIELKLGGYLEDNVTVELNPQHQSSAAQMGKIVRALKTEFTAATGYAFSSLNEYQFKASELVHPKAMAFGCDPDWDAYDNAVRERVNPEVVGNWRFCGGHIHIGIDPWPNIPKNIFIQFLDLFAFGEYAQYDKAERRRPFYGLAGLFRPKSYGVEYRTPSNFWCTDDATLRGTHNFPSMVERVVRQLVHQAETDRNILTNMYRSIDWAEVRQSISAGQQPKAYGDFYNDFGQIPQYKAPPSEKTLDELLEENNDALRRLRDNMPRYGGLQLAAQEQHEQAQARARRARMQADPEYIRLQDVFNNADDAVASLQDRYNSYENLLADGEDGYTEDGLDDLHIALEDARQTSSEAAQEWSDYEDNWQDPGADPVVDDLIERILEDMAPEPEPAQRVMNYEQAQAAVYGQGPAQGQNAANFYFDVLQPFGGGGRGVG